MKNIVSNLVAEIQTSYTQSIDINDAPQISTSKKAHDIFREKWGPNMNLFEEFHVLYVEQGGRDLKFQ